jgi:hypothetical protein
MICMFKSQLLLVIKARILDLLNWFLLLALTYHALICSLVFYL